MQRLVYHLSHLFDQGISWIQKQVSITRSPVLSMWKKTDEGRLLVIHDHLLRCVPQEEEVEASQADPLRLLRDCKMVLINAVLVDW